MKYEGFQGNTVNAVYGNGTAQTIVRCDGNPYLDALPELLTKREFEDRMRSRPEFPREIDRMTPEERRSLLTGLSSWFQPMDYMYTIYDMLCRAMMSTYQTKTVMESVRQINDLYTDLRTGRERTLLYSTQAYSGAVLGAPGIGKTSTIKRCLSLMPQVIVHREYQGKTMYEKQINYLTVECPSDCSLRTLALNIFSAIDRTIGSEYLKQATYQKAVATSATTTKLKIICMNHHIGLIVIDEIQNAITTAARNKQMKPLIKFLVELTNETATAVCFCGTLEAEEVFLKQEHLKRRTRGYRLLPMKYDAAYRKFIMELWDYQATLRKTPLTEKLMKQIYDMSAGIPAYLVKIFEEAQVRCILSGKERLCYESIKQAVEYLGIEVPKVYGRGGTSISDFSVGDVEAVEFTEETGKTGNQGEILTFRTRVEGKPGVSRVELPGESENIKSGKNQLSEQSEQGFEGCSAVRAKEPETVSKPYETVREPGMSEACVSVREPQDIPAETEKEPLEAPVKRYYAVQRGRKKADRDETDLIALWNENPSPERILSVLEGWDMAERRRF